MSITYNAGTNEITLDGNNTYSFESIYQADVAGGWGVVNKQGYDQYLITANIVLGDGSNETKLIDEDCAIQLGNNTNQRYIETKANSIFKLTTSYFEWWAASTGKNWSGKTYLYNSVVFKRGDASYTEPLIRNDIEILNCYLDVKGWYVYRGKLTLKDSVLSMYNNIFWLYSPSNHDIDNATIKNGYYGINIGYGYSPIAKNLKFSNNNYDIRLFDNNTSLTLVDSIFDKTKLEFITDTNILYDKKSFKIKVTDKNSNSLSGAVVKLYDINNNLIFEDNTNSNGEISTQEITYKKYEGTSITETTYSPHTLKITKEGYTNYETKITIDRKFDNDVFVLDALTYTYDNIMKMLKAIYVK